MSDDLVKRLRGWARDIQEGSTATWAMDQDLKGAASRIEALQAENVRLETEAKLQAEEIDKTRRRADKWQSMVIDCEKYLKPGETPRQRMDRDHADVLGLIKLLEKEKQKSERLEAKLAKAVEVAEKSIKWLRLYGADVHREAATLAELTGSKE